LAIQGVDRRRRSAAPLRLSVHKVVNGASTALQFIGGTLGR